MLDALFQLLIEVRAMLLVLVRGLQRIGAVAAVVLTLVMVPCGGVPVAVVVGWGRLDVHGWFHLDRGL